MNAKQFVRSVPLIRWADDKTNTRQGRLVGVLIAIALWAMLGYIAWHEMEFYDNTTIIQQP